MIAQWYLSVSFIDGHNQMPLIAWVEFGFLIIDIAF